VSDSGIEIPDSLEGNKPGLGTNIVEALAKRLDAKVQVARASRGTAVSIIHTQLAAAPVVRNA
jgi:two-component system, sensor histidine kinase PdtaS